VSRLWGGLGGWGQSGPRAVLAGVKAAALLVLAGAVLWGRRFDLAALASQDLTALAGAGGGVLRRIVEPLALGLVVLGLGDFVLRWRRIEAILRMTPEQQREEIKSADGDPAVRRRQRRMAESRRSDMAELIEGAALVVTAGRGLGVVLAGEGPPGRVRVRLVARGAALTAVLTEAAKSNLTVVEAASLARHLARGRFQGLTPQLSDELGRIWPRA
jgi:flagellar biosynthetic protein FlhB